MPLRPRLAVLLALALSFGTACKGKPSKSPEAESAQAMGSWDEWLELKPLIEVARSHASKPTVEALEKAGAMLRDGKAKSADLSLAKLAGGEGRHWIAVARADLAALYFTVCIRGVAWRLVDLDPKTPLTRRSDYSAETKLVAGDLAVEALLTNLDAAVATKDPILGTQARIARARATAYVSRCPANKEVRDMAEGILKSDLATLAAENHLTPDLAYLWAGVQLGEYSGAAARPFLLQAREGGYRDPAIPAMLAMIALEQRELDPAEAYAKEAEAEYKKIGDREQQAQAIFLRGEVARARGDAKTAGNLYKAAQQLDPGHMPALLGLVHLALEAGGANAAIRTFQAALPGLLPGGPLAGDKMLEAVDNLEALVTVPLEGEMLGVCRDALITDVELEKDPARRGLRYFFAATLDARLGEYDHARAHAVLARDEFQAGEVESPIDVAGFIERLDSVQ